MRQRGVAVAGHRAYFLKGPGVKLNLALINYGVAFLTARKYTPLQTPFFMNQEVMAGVAQLSEFDETLYSVNSGEDKKYLIATSEQPICAYHKDEWLSEKDLPIRCSDGVLFCAMSVCVCVCVTIARVYVFYRCVCFGF